MPDSLPRQLRRAELAALLARAERAYAAGTFGEAVRACQRALVHEPDNPKALQLLGAMAQKTGANDVAIGFFTRALAGDRRLVAAHLGLGDALGVAGRWDEALASYRRAVALAPRQAEAYVSLATALLTTGQREAAVASFRQASMLDPGHRLAAYMLAELRGETGREQADYVRATFDDYAKIFDEHLVATLKYRMPELLASTLAELHPAPFSAVLDLGCGTGLVADAFGTARAGAIDGVDLSAEMLAVARGKGRYRTLEVADLRDVLKRPATRAAGYDLVTAADVFIYVGALDDVFPAIHAVLPETGLFAFSVEHLDGDGYVIQPSGRHAHSEGYIAELAAVAGFSRLRVTRAPLRQENKVDIPGRLEVLRRA
jgi:predicted TPR repeat methyltransferase